MTNKKGNYNVLVIILLIIIVFLLSLIILFATNTISFSGNNVTFDIDDSVSNSADVLIDSLINSSDYSKMSIDEKKDSCEKLLKKLKKEKLIKYYSYDNSNKLYSFVYDDGTLGGIKLEDFDSDYN